MNCNVTTEMNKFAVDHMRHTDDYSLSIELGQHMIDMTSSPNSGVKVTIFYLTPEGMLALGNAICAEAYKAKAELERRNVEVK